MCQGRISSDRLSDGITHLTFDCYGTLIDWEQGLLSALKPWLVRSGGNASAEALLRSFVTHEARIEAGSWRPYREVLRGVMSGIAFDLGIALRESDAGLLADSLPSWPPFPDTVTGLTVLSKAYKLVIVSNIDDDLITATQKELKVTFAEVITAEQVRSYKPAMAHFREVPRRLGVPVGRILHVAQSLYHDHAPAQRLGFRTAWVKRPSLLSRTGLAPEAHVQPNLVFPDLKTLAAALVS